MHLWGQGSGTVKPDLLIYTKCLPLNFSKTYSQSWKDLQLQGHQVIEIMGVVFVPVQSFVYSVNRGEKSALWRTSRNRMERGQCSLMMNSLRVVSKKVSNPGNQF